MNLVNLARKGCVHDVVAMSLQVDFKISQLAISGLKVNRLDVYCEVRVLVTSPHPLPYSLATPPLFLQKYKPFKGIKYITKAGKFQVRS